MLLPLLAAAAQLPLPSDDLAAATFQPPVLVGRSAEVPCGEPSCRPHCHGCYAGNTPVVDGVVALAPGVLVTPWTSGYALGQGEGNLAVAISLTNGRTWSNRTVLPAGNSLLSLPNLPWVWTARPALGLLNLGGGCNASEAPGKAVAAQCPQFKCSPTASPAYATLVANASSPTGISLSASCGQVEFRGFPHPLGRSGLLSGWGDDGGSPTITRPVRLPDGTLLMSIAMTPADEAKRNNKAYPQNLVVWRSVDGGRLWTYLSVAVNHTQIRDDTTTFGASEHDLSLLSDNKTLMMVMRTDGDGKGYGCPAAGGRYPWHYYYQTYSRDLGVTWSAPRPIPGAGAVRPRLLLLESGALVLTGGRMCKAQLEQAPVPSCLPTEQPSGGGVFVWVNADGMADLDGKRNGSEWVAHCVTAAHNRLWKGDPSLLWTNTTGTQAYTSVVALGANAVGVTYAHGEALPDVATFMMRLDLAAD